MASDILLSCALSVRDSCLNMQTFSCIAALAATCLSTCVARSTTTTSSSISSATAIAGNYSGALRPQIHFSPPVGFMNDPNGLHRDAEGIWHLYYQCKPPLCQKRVAERAHD